MSLTGNATANKVLRGRINRLDTLCVSAYGIAVKNGFEGTEEEWLESLKGEKGEKGNTGEQGEQGERGEKGDPGTAATDEQIKSAVEEYMEENPIPTASPINLSTINLFASAWVGSGNLYSQVVSIDGITEKSQVNLTPSVEQLAIFYEKDISFVTENDGGLVTVYVIGQKPESDYIIQANIVEVTA